MRPLLTVLLVLGLVLPAAGLHPNSRSRTLLRVEGGQVRATVRCQVESVREVLDIDPDANGVVDEDEFAALESAVGEYVLEHYGLRAGPEEDAARVPGEVLSARLVTEDYDALAFLQFVDVELAWELEPPVLGLDVEMDLFLVTSPRHTDSGLVVWPRGDSTEYQLWAARPRISLEAPPVPPEPGLLDDLEHGARAVWAGGRHLVFILALLVTAPRLRTFGALLAAFAGMACAASVFVLRGDVTPATDSLTLGVSLSLVWLGGLTVLRRAARPPWAEALLFGLLHGASLIAVGTAGRPLPPDEPARLAGFLAGAVAVWLGAAAVALLVLRPLPRRTAGAAGPRDTALVPGYARDAVSLGLALLGTWWAASQLAA